MEERKEGTAISEAEPKLNTQGKLYSRLLQKDQEKPQLSVTSVKVTRAGAVLRAGMREEWFSNWLYPKEKYTVSYLYNRRYSLEQGAH